MPVVRTVTIGKLLTDGVEAVAVLGSCVFASGEIAVDVVTAFDGGGALGGVGLGGCTACGVWVGLGGCAAEGV